MRRTPFLSRHARERDTSATREARACALLRPIRQLAPAAAAFNPQPKREYVRSRPLLDACRLLACQSCGIADGTVVAAHSNWRVHGKFKSIKADDNRVAAMCAACHRALDQGGRDDQPTKQLWWWEAHARTVNLLVLRGLWPRDVPVPETGTYPAEWTPCTPT